MKRNLLVSSDTPSRKIYISKRHNEGSYTGYHIVSLTAAAALASPNWAFKSTYQTSSDAPLGLVFGESESFLFLFAKQNSKCLIQRINAVTGSVSWTQSFTPTSSISYPLLQYKSTSGVLVGGLSASGVQVFRLQISGGLVTSADSFIDTSQTGLEMRALYVSDSDTVSVLMWGTIGGVAD
jgi:hypothetical protein